MKKWLSVLLAMILVLTSAASLAETDIWAKYEEPTTVTIARGGGTYNYTTEGDVLEDNAYLDWLKETYNIDVEYALTTAGGDYVAALSAMITSGELPDIIFVNNESQIKMLVESGMVMDLTDVYEEWASPLVKDIVASYGEPEDVFYSTTIDGRIYGMRSFAPGYQYNLLWIRTDWLEKVGAEVPTTMEELEKVAQLFVDNNLGGEGTTVGIEIHNNIAGTYNSTAMADPVFGYNNAYPKQWIEKEGKIVYGSVQPEAKEALALLADWYQKGLLDPEFATKDFNESISAGYSGIVFAPWWGNGQMKNAIANVEGAMWQCVPCILSPEGTYNVYDNDSENGWAVVNANCEHPEMLFRLMNICADVTTLAREPITDYTTVRPAELRALDTNPASMWNAWPYAIEIQLKDAQYRISKALVAAVEDGATENYPETTLNEAKLIQQYMAGETTDLTAWNSWSRYTARKQMLDINDKLHIEPCYFPATTDTMALFWDNLKTLEENTYKRIIMGELSIDDFDAFVEDWMAQGGADITAEVNAQFGK